MPKIQKSVYYIIDRPNLTHRRIGFDAESFIMSVMSQKQHTGEVCINHITCKFHCFTVHFDSLSFIYTNSCTFSYNYVSVF